MKQAYTFTTQLVKIQERTCIAADITIADGKITAIAAPSATPEGYLLPGFIDAHVHIESSMLVPAQFARQAVVHGTVATVSDPHEIANVLGEAGVHYMLDNAKGVLFHFCFGAPSCVPATPFETAGAELDVTAVTQLLQRDDIAYLAEMMNWPGVLERQPEVMAKIAAARAAGKPVDGHAPGLTGEQAAQYASAGIATDHECYTLAEAEGKLKLGMQVLIREGSAAKNFTALHPLIDTHYEKLMFCSDDKHPDELLLSHINALVARAVAEGHDVYKVLQMACINPAKHYRLPLGEIAEGEEANCCLVNNLSDFKVLKTWCKGRLVAEAGRPLLETGTYATPNRFRTRAVAAAELAVKATGKMLRVIEAIDGELITAEQHIKATVADGLAIANIQQDVLKLVVVNRYAAAPPAVAFVKGFGLKSGAMATSIAHDSHNIIAVGCTDAAIAEAINLLMQSSGGCSVVAKNIQHVLPLPVAGLMSAALAEEVAAAYTEVHLAAKGLGSELKSPFMTLSFMALLVIPQLKLSDKGLFDGSTFAFTSLWADKASST
jgi:adenine deaminase